MKPIFLDTVGLIAVWDESDQWHEAAEAVYSDIVSRRHPTGTTTWILMECGNAASRRPYRPDVDDLRLRLASRGRLVTPTDEEIESAWSAYRRGLAGQRRHRRSPLLRRDAAARAHPGIHERRPLQGGGVRDLVLMSDAGRVHDLFGERLPVILDELNRRLAA